MPTPTQEATDMYAQLKPGAKDAYIDYVANRTPARLQTEMATIVRADLANALYTPPTNVDVPLVTQTGTGVGSSLNCTLGNWNNMYDEPHSYSFQWKKGLTNVGINSATYPVVTGDVGASFTCVVTAINPAGSASATSNAKVVA